jgi:hypothetical protein
LERLEGILKENSPEILDGTYKFLYEQYEPLRLEKLKKEKRRRCTVPKYRVPLPFCGGREKYIPGTYKIH